MSDRAGVLQSLTMAVEPRRRCGYRKIGATYLEAPPGGFACGRMPLAILPCPLCDHRPAFTRGLQRITPKTVLHAAKPCPTPADACARCPLGAAVESETAGLLWVGARFYTPADFNEEAEQLGVSKRIGVPPKWLQVGLTWVFLAHERAITEPCPACAGRGQTLGFRPPPDAPSALFCPDCEGSGTRCAPGIFRAFVPQRIVRIIPDTMPEADREALRHRGLTLVVVPADDPDHQPATRARAEEEDDEA